jgi:hypothetical protein
LKTVDKLIIESQLALKGRATIVIGILLLLVAFWGYMASYQQAARIAVSEEERMIPVYGVEKYMLWLQEDPAAKDTRELFQNLKPVAGPNYILSVFAVVGPMLAAIWGALFFGNEFVWRTAKMRAAHYGWVSSIKTKIVVVLFANLIVGLIGSLVGLLGGHISFNLILRATEIAKWVGDPVIVASFWQQILVLWLGLSYYGLLGGFLAIVFKSPVAGSVIGFAVPYIEAYIGQMLPMWWLPHTAYNELMAGSFTYLTGSIVRIGSNPGFAAVSPYLPWAVVGGWLFLICASMITLSKWQEIA